MADRTSIEWTEATWNPATGCTKVSPGCDHCYAETIAHRFAGTKAYPDGFAPTLRPERLDQPLRWQRPRRIFVCSMADLFHDSVPDDFIAGVFETMARAPQHTFQVLTKRHARMRTLLSRPSFRDNLAHWGGGWPLPNVWLGVSAENQHWADIRIPALLDTPAAVRWVSAEPLLGPIDLAAWMPPGRANWRCAAGCGRFFAGDWMTVCPSCSREGYWSGSHVGNGRPNGQPLGWVVAGGESGHGARPMHPDWVRSIRDQCAASDVPFLFKQWGQWAPSGAWGGGIAYDGQVWARPLRDRPSGVHPDALLELVRVGKKKAGRELDGVQHDGYPFTASAQTNERAGR